MLLKWKYLIPEVLLPKGNAASPKSRIPQLNKIQEIHREYRLVKIDIQGFWIESKSVPICITHAMFAAICRGLACDSDFHDIKDLISLADAVEQPGIFLD